MPTFSSPRGIPAGRQAGRNGDSRRRRVSPGFGRRGSLGYPDRLIPTLDPYGARIVTLLVVTGLRR